MFRWVVCLFVGVLPVSAASSNPIRFISQPLQPASVRPGTSNMKLTVHGTGFVAGSVVLFNQQSLPTTFVNNEALVATIPASDLTVRHGALITVRNPAPGGGVSNAAFFEVTDATPSAFFLLGTHALTSGTTNSFVEGDFNRDGKLDFVAAMGSSIAVLLSNGDGTFKITEFSTTAQFVGTLVAGDFNGDGKLDLAFPDPFHDLVHVLLGKGDGTFLETSTTLVGHHPAWTVAADFNSDGKLDLAVTNQVDGTVSILLGDGNGTFTRKMDVRVGSQPNALAAGDFNGDGKLDLAVVNSGSNTLSLLLGQGDGTFRTKATIPTGASPYAVTAADFNRDGKLDLAVTNACGNAKSCASPGFASITLLQGKGDGTFWRGTKVLTDYHNPQGIVAADVNADGLTDLVITGFTESNGVVLFGDGKGGFPNMFATSHSAVSQFVVVGDFNNDGRLDFAVNNSFEVQGTRGITIEKQTPLAFYPAILNFAPQTVGTTSPPQTVRLANVGLTPANISPVMIGRDFSETNNCSLTLTSGASCTITVTFTPGSVGVTASVISVTDEASGSDLWMSLVGMESRCSRPVRNVFWSSVRV